MTTRYRPEDRDDPDETELLAERGQREVRVDLRDRRPPGDERQSPSETRAEQPAAGEGVERLDDLVAGPGRVGERIQPDVHPCSDIAHGLVQDEAADDEEHEPDDHRAHPPRGRMYRSSRKTAKNSSAAPRSRWTTTIPSAIAHIATIGARYGSGGSRIGPIRVSCSTRSARFSDR